MILDRFKLTDRVAIVTGAGKGIGRGIAIAFAEAGAHVVCAARTLADLESTAAEVRARGRRALPVVCDVTKSDQLERLAAAALAEFARVDLLVNNAGGTGPRPALETSERFFEAALRFNLTSAFLLTRLLVPKMIETAGGGAVVNISSRASDMVQTGFVAYGFAKAPLNMLPEPVRRAGAQGARKRHLVGGWITESLSGLTNQALRGVRAHTPMGRPGHRGHRGLRALPRSPRSGW